MYFNNKTKLTPGQVKLQNELMSICKQLTEGCYIKGFGDKKDRIMTHDHSPVVNIDRSITVLLKQNELIEKSGLVYIPTVKVHTIKKHELILSL